MMMSSEPSNIQAPDSTFDDEWLSENPMDSPIGGRGQGDEGLRLATNSPAYTGPESLQNKNDPYTISVDADDDEENPPESSPSGNAKSSDPETSSMQQQRRRKIITTVALAVVVVLIVVIVSVIVSKNKKGGEEAEQSNENPNNNNATIPNATMIPTNQSETIDTEDNYFLPYLGNRDGIVTYATLSGPFTVEIPTLASSIAGVYQDEDEVRDGLSRMALFLMNNAAQRLVGASGFSSVGNGVGGAIEDYHCGCNPQDPTSSCPPPFVEEEIPEMEVVDGDQAAPGSGVGDVNAYETNNQEEMVDQADVAKSDGMFIYAAFGSKLLILDVVTGELVLTLDLPSPICRNITYGCPGIEVPQDIDVGGNAAGNMSSMPTNDTVEDTNVVPAAPNASDFLPLADEGNYTYCPQVNIDSILLDANNSRMALVVSGYGDELRDDSSTPILSDLLGTQIRMYSLEALVVNGGGVGLIGIQNINGVYRQGYLMEENGIAHIVTSTTLNTRDSLVKPLEALQTQDVSLNGTEYFKSIRNARSDIVTAFVNQTLAELSLTAGDLPRIAPMRLPVEVASDVDGFEQILLGEGYANQMIQITSFDMREDPTFAENATAGTIEVSQTVQFLPDANGEVYSEEEMMVLTGNGFQFVEDITGSEDMTVLYAYTINGMTTTPFATGKVPGHLLNRYALDYHDGLFRAATSIQRWLVDDVLSGDPTMNSTGTSVTGSNEGNDGGDEVNVRRMQKDFDGNFGFISECPDADGIAADECFTNDTLAECTEMTERGCNSYVYSNDTCPVRLLCMDDLTGSQCPLPSMNSTNSCLDFENLSACLDLVKSGCTDIAILESCPLQFSCNDEPPASPSTLNRVFVLQPPSGNGTEMTIVGNVTLGKPNEVFTAVRFFDDIAYAVTFLRTDPFYAISFEEDPKTPVVLGQLEITGFSMYMHSINGNNTKILALGMEADANGQETSLKLSLFDATNRTAPVEVFKYVLSEESDTWSGSSAQWDFLAFRYVYLTEEEGRIIIPIYYSDSISGEFFDGFKVFSLDAAGILPLFDISHNIDNVFIRKLDVLPEEESCNCGYLQDRSFVIDGDVITLKGQSARSHTLATGDEVWGLNFAGPEFCCL